MAGRTCWEASTVRTDRGRLRKATGRVAALGEAGGNNIIPPTGGTARRGGCPSPRSGGSTVDTFGTTTR